MKVSIQELNGDLIPKAKKLVDSIFPHQSFDERISFFVYKHRANPLVRLATKLYGGMEVFKKWVAIDENGDICGTTGVYSERRDSHEALWLSWFCVAPNKRGMGIGKQLIEFSIDVARNHGVKYLRLYTSDDPIEMDAQILYEKYDFKKIHIEQKSGYVQFYREKLLRTHD